MRIKSVGLFLLGGMVIGSALFAEAIRLDNDPGWGKGRVAILFFGILILVYGAYSSLYPERVLSLSKKIQPLIFQNTVNLLKLFQRYWYTFPAFICVILVYVWFASSGAWFNWVSPTRYYADLASSFEQGKLHLAVRPNSDLLNLKNPYDPDTRQGINFFIDYSLYNRKYYLYWGPVPALILVIINPFTPGRVGDLYLVFSFVCGIFLCQFLLAITIWERFFHDLPGWILTVSILMLGLTAPWTYTLINEPNGRIYEAAISGAQLFFMGGFLIAVIAFSKAVPSSRLLAITGFLWALAIGTRLVMVLPIAFLMAMIAYQIWKTSSVPLRQIAIKLVILSVPIGLGLLCLGWYNWARFGSLTETGFSYALAEVNLQKYHSDLFAPIYVVQNLYNYVVKPPAGIAQFPFLYSENVRMPFYSLPNIYTTSPVTGLVFIAPITILALMTIVTFLIKPAQNTSGLTTWNRDNDLFHWIIISLLGASFWAFCLLLIFFWAAMRYSGDFMPALMMVSTLGFWRGYKLLEQRPIWKRVYSLIGAILIVTGMVVSILLSISVMNFGLYGM